ncbi:MAG: hypothetical protein E6G90_03520 [Alphaproteobacteria bacterium]|nr:MAG: hypothetical protein E6G90_03520 [Alphaproteobacteria bacterium]
MRSANWVRPSQGSCSYGPNYRRLRRLKAKYDPENFFPSTTIFARFLSAGSGYCYFMRSWILAMAARAHSSSKLPPGAPLTPIPPIAFPPLMMVTPPTP